MHREVVAEVRARLPPEVQLLDQLVGMEDRCVACLHVTLSICCLMSEFEHSMPDCARTISQA